MRLCSSLGETARFLIMVIVFFLMSSGMVAMVNAGVGTPPWDVLHLGLSCRLGLSYGRIIHITGLALILLSFIMGVKPRTGTVLNMLLIGIFVDLIRSWNLLPFPTSPLFRYLQVLAGIMIFAYGTAVYILLDRGTGPRDSFMIALSRLTGLNMGLVRTLIEITVTVSGFMLGGPLGAGTIIFALTVGFFMQLFFKVTRYQARLSRRFYLRFLAKRNRLHG